MGEIKLVVPGRQLSYSGIFDGKELYRLIKGQLGDFGYDNWVEKEHTEKHTKTHKQVEITYFPVLTVSDYIKLHIGIDIKYMNLKDITVEYKGKKIKAQEGDLSLEFKGYMVTDYEKNWEKGKSKYSGIKSVSNYFFIRTIMDKFILNRYHSKYEKILSDQIRETYNNVREYLNTTKHR